MKKKVVVVTLLALAVIGYVIFNIQYSRYREVNIASRAKVSVFRTDRGTRGKGPESIIDSKEDTWWYGYTDEEHPNWVVLSWKEPKRIDKVTINFGGYRYALDYKLQVWDGVLRGAPWIDVAVVNNNRSDQVTHIFPKEIKAPISEMRLYVTSTFQPDNLLRVSEFSVYQKQLKSFLPLDILVYLGYIALLLLILFGIFKFLPQWLKKILGVKYGRIVIFIFGVILATAVFLIFFNTAKQKYIYVNLAPEAVISAKQTESAVFPQDQGGSCLSAVDGNERTWWYGTVENNNDNWLLLRWDRPRVISKVDIIFGCNRFAKKYRIQSWINEEWKDTVITKDNYRDKVMHHFNESDSIQTDKIRILFRNTIQPDRILRVSEVFVFNKIPATFLNALIKNTINPCTELINRILLRFALLFMLFIPGFVVLNFWKSTFTIEEKFVFSFGLTILLIFLLTILFLSTGALFWHSSIFLNNLPVFFILLEIFFLVSFIKRKLYHFLREMKDLIFLLLVVPLLLLTAYFFISDKSFYNLYGGDYLWQYGVANVLMNKLNYFFYHKDFIIGSSDLGLRTILLGIIYIPFKGLLNNNFLIYQSLSDISSILFLLPFYLLVKKIFNKKTAVLASIFLIINPYLIFMSALAQVRWLICFFIFLYFYFLLHENLDFRAKYLLSGTSAGLAFMTHPVSLPFILGGMFYILLKEKVFPKKQQALLLTTLCMGAFLVPWFTWCFLAKQSLLFYTPILIRGTDIPSLPFYQKILALLSAQFKTIPDKIWTIIGLLVFNPKGIQLAPYYGQMGCVKNFYRFTLLGAGTIFLPLFSIYGFIKYFRRYTREIVSFVFVPCIVLLLYAGRHSCRMMDSIVPLLPMMIAFATYVILFFSKPIQKKLLSFLYISSIFHYVYLAWFLGFSITLWSIITINASHLNRSFLFQELSYDFSTVLGLVLIAACILFLSITYFFTINKEKCQI